MTIWILWPPSTDFLFPYFEKNHQREVNFSIIIPKDTLSPLLPGITYSMMFRGCNADAWIQVEVPEEEHSAQGGCPLETVVHIVNSR